MRTVGLTEDAAKALFQVGTNGSLIFNLILRFVLGILSGGSYLEAT
jgi:hypothetical protein